MNSDIVERQMCSSLCFSHIERPLPYTWTASQSTAWQEGGKPTSQAEDAAALGQRYTHRRGALKGPLVRERGQMPPHTSPAPRPCRSPQDKVWKAGSQTPYKQMWQNHP